MWIVDCGGFSPNVINTIYWKVWKRKLERSGEYVNVYLVNERDVVPEDHHLLIQIVVDGVGAVGGDGDALPLGAPVLDPVESHDGFALSGCWWADVGGGGEVTDWPGGCSRTWELCVCGEAQPGQASGSPGQSRREWCRCSSSTSAGASRPSPSAPARPRISSPCL